MRYVKITTSDEETRWINLEQVCRVTLATDRARGFPVLAIVFADGSLEDKFLINGNTEADRKAIETLTAALDSVANA